MLEPLFLGYKALKVRIYTTIRHYLPTEYRVTIYTVEKVFKNQAGFLKHYTEITVCVPRGADKPFFWLCSPHFYTIRIVKTTKRDI